MKPACTCIVPAFNEASRINAVLRQLNLVKECAEIIVVNDGSTDDTLNVLSKSKLKITLVALPQTLGKAGAVKEGLKKVGTSHVFLCDADLTNLNPAELAAAVQQILKKPKLDMIILHRFQEISHMMDEIDENSAIFKLFRMRKIFTNSQWFMSIDRILSGERVIKTKLLKNILKGDTSGYSLEAAINQYCLDQQQKTCWMYSSAVSSISLQSLGKIKCLCKYVTMHLKIMLHVGIENYLLQIRSFCKIECEAVTAPST